MSRTRGLVFLLMLLATAKSRAQDSAVTVEPGDVVKRAAELAGKAIVVDDRVRYFQNHPQTGFDQIFLKRTDVPFELPARLRPTQSPTTPSVKVRGILRKEGDRVWVDVTSFEPMTSDLDRLNRGVALLPRTDVEGRNTWARWAEQRAEAFDDQPLRKRAREVEVETIRIEADRPAKDPAAHWLALADRARSRKLAEPEPSALAHRGFRSALLTTKSAADLAKLESRIDAFFPDARSAPEGAIDLPRWEKPYANNPAEAYRSAPEDVRKTLDHRLWADSVQQRLERQSFDDPSALISLSDEAARLIPDRPLVTRKLLEDGLAMAGGNVANLRQAEIENLARLYRDVLHEPEQGKTLVRSWLDDQRARRLSAGDAEGRLLLAEQYENLLDDRASSVAIVREAFKIDPGSRQVADAFRRLGYRREGNEWVERVRPRPTETAARPTDAASSSPDGDTPAAVEPRPVRNGLLNATAEEVKARFVGRPNKKLRVANASGITEQWVYVEPTQVHYVTFQRQLNDTRMRVVSYYTLPKRAK